MVINKETEFVCFVYFIVDCLKIEIQVIGEHSTHRAKSHKIVFLLHRFLYNGEHLFCFHIEEKSKFHCNQKYVLINEKENRGSSLLVNINIPR